MIFRGACVWLQAIDSPQQVRQVYDYVEAMMAAGGYVPPPAKLQPHHFTRYDFDAKCCSADSELIPA